MSSKTKAKAPRKRPRKQKKIASSKTEQQIDKDFLDDYKKLCKKYRRGLLASPFYRYSEERREFGTVINLSVDRWKPEPE